MYSKDIFLERAQQALLDGGIVFSTFLAAAILRHSGVILGPEPGRHFEIAPYLFPATLLSVAFVLLFRYERLYSGRMGRFAEAFRIARGATGGTMAALALTFFYRGHSYSRATVLIFYPMVVTALVAARNLYRRYRSAVHANPAARRRVLIVGFGQVGQHLGRVLLARPSYYELVGFLDDDPAKQGAALEGRRVHGTLSDLERLVRDNGVDEIIIAIPSARRDRVMEIVGACLRLKVRWKVVPDLYDILLERLTFDQVGDLPLAGLRGPAIVGFNWALKRAFDLGLASVLLVVASPIFLFAAAAIKLTSRGPVFFRQTRVGLRGRPFVFLKFRSMRVGGDATIHQDYTSDWIYGRSGGPPRQPAPRSLGAAAAREPEPVAPAAPLPPTFAPQTVAFTSGLPTAAADPTPTVAAGVHKIVRDPRVTFVGGLLRRTSLDELPQLWNVLRGDMSLVGPRPAIPYEVERYTEWHKRRLETLPGITGLWQVSGRNALSFEEMVRLDIQYIETWSLELDMKILLKTLPALLFGRAY
jgi:exopolysaccharide biosynthesis polyprenyl glycosylphosphotransferase